LISLIIYYKDNKKLNNIFILMENIKVTLLCPCAGLSSRFNGRPKWSLTNPNGKLMIEDALSLLDLKNVSMVLF
jgi:hypothetical protein